MAFTNSVTFSVDVPILVDVRMAVAGGTVGAKEAANVEIIAVETVGMIVCGVVANSLYLNYMNLSSSFSISFN